MFRQLRIVPRIVGIVPGGGVFAATSGQLAGHVHDLVR